MHYLDNLFQWGWPSINNLPLCSSYLWLQFLSRSHEGFPNAGLLCFSKFFYKQSFNSDFKRSPSCCYKFCWHLCSLSWENSCGDWNLLYIIEDYASMSHILFQVCDDYVNQRQKQKVNLECMWRILGLPSWCPPASPTSLPTASSLYTGWPLTPYFSPSVRTALEMMGSINLILWARLTSKNKFDEVNLMFFRDWWNLWKTVKRHLRQRRGERWSKVTAIRYSLPTIVLILILWNNNLKLRC